MKRAAAERLSGHKKKAEGSTLLDDEHQGLTISTEHSFYVQSSKS